jgi:3-isopropylmalate/(R)-2-methylmalate dehydratase small subunit
MSKQIRANAYRVGDDVKALDIMPTRFKSSTGLSDAELAKAAFADLDPSFSAKALAGDYGIVVAGVNFGGGGKTVEGPVFALRGAGVRLVIAESFARFFLRNAINNAFPVLVCPGITQAVQTGQALDVDLVTARISNLASGQVLTATPLSATALQILDAGGLVPYAREKLAQRASGRASA